MQTKTKYHVLLVDDDDLIRDVVGEMLMALGYEVTWAKDGIDALRLFKNGDGVHIVLTDINMPAMDGWQLADQIKSIKPDTPIVALTGAESSRVIPKLSSDGIGKALFKPLRMDHLKDTMLKLVDKLD